MSGSLASRHSRRFCLWPLHASQARFIHLAVSRDPEKPFPAKPSASNAIGSSHQTIHAIGMGNSGNKTHQNRHRKERGRKKFFFFSSLAGSLFPTSTAPLSRSPREKETHKMMFCRAQQQQSQPQQQQHQQPQPQRLAPTLFSEARADHAEVVARVLRANPAAASVREAATGGTALHAACAAGALAAVRALLAAPVPARLDAVDDSGDTPLHCAARGGHAECIEELLSSFPSSSSALARRRNAAGRCPLHEAAACCSHAACKALLSAGARRSALDAEGMTAADLVPRGADSTEAAVLYAMVLSGRSASVAERALCSFGAAAAAPAAAAAAPAAGGSSSNLLLRRRDSRPWVAAAAARIASSSSSRKPAAAAGTQQQQQHQQLPARQQLRVVASASTDYGGESPAAPPAPGPAAPSSCAAAAAASAAAAPSPSAAAAGLFAESCSSLFVGARSVKGAPGASSSSSAAAAAASASPALRVAAAERRVEEVVDVVSRLAAAVEGTRAAVEADREAARREVAALRDEARERAAAADEALSAVDGRLASLLREEEETKAARAAKAAVEEEEAVAAAAAAAAAASYSSDDSATSYETAPSGTEAAEANDPSSASSSTSLPSPFPSSSSLSLSTEFAPEHLLRNAVPSFAHVPRSVDGLRGALASLERRVARGEEWDAAASGFARSVGLELEKLQIEVSESARARLMGEARLDAAERGVEMLHGYLKTAAVALGPEAVEDARKRGAALSAAAATLANEKKARKAMEEELRRVKEACRELQGRLDEVEKEKGREAPAPAARAAIASEASAACASASGASAPARPRNRRRSSFLGGLFKPSTAVSRLGKGERRRLSSCSGAETNGLALAMTAAAARGGAEEEEVRVVVEEAE